MDKNYSILCIGDINFGVSVQSVKEIIQLPKYTRMPNTHKSILGIFNLRGEIYSILDFRVLLGQQKANVSSKNLIVIIEHENINFGVVVDKVLDVIEIESANIQTPGKEIDTSLAKYINGVYSDDKFGKIHLMDIAAVSAADEINSYRFQV